MIYANIVTRKPTMRPTVSVAAPLPRIEEAALGFNNVGAMVGAATGLEVGLAFVTAGTGAVIVRPVADPTLAIIEFKAAVEDTAVVKAAALAVADGLLTTTV